MVAPGRGGEGLRERAQHREPHDRSDEPEDPFPQWISSAPYGSSRVSPFFWALQTSLQS